MEQTVCLSRPSVAQGVGASCVYDRPLGVRVRNKKRTANTENGLGKQQQVSSSTSPATVSSATPPVAVGGGAGVQHHHLDDGQESSRHHSYREGGPRLLMNDSSRKRQRPLLPGEGAGLSPALAAAMPLSNLGSTVPPPWGVPPDPSAFVPPPAAPGGGGGPGQRWVVPDLGFRRSLSSFGHEVVLALAFSLSTLEPLPTGSEAPPRDSSPDRGVFTRPKWGKVSDSWRESFAL